jgi:hypothetical protein
MPLEAGGEWGGGRTQSGCSCSILGVLTRLRGIKEVLGDLGGADVYGAYRRQPSDSSPAGRALRKRVSASTDAVRTCAGTGSDVARSAECVRAMRHLVRHAAASSSSCTDDFIGYSGVFLSETRRERSLIHLGEKKPMWVQKKN